MTVGGMVGGGIFSNLGVVIEISGTWPWLSFMSAWDPGSHGYALCSLCAYVPEETASFGVAWGVYKAGL